MTQKPTGVRWRVFFALLILVTINYVDRAVISVLMPLIQADLHFSPELVGVILSAFFWGYVLMQIPSGWLCDKFAPGKVIVGTGILWGVFQIFTGFIHNSTVFIAIRALLGVSEAPIYPSGGKLQSVWLTKNERGKGAALMDVGSALGNAVGAPLCALFVAFLDGWRGALIAAGVLTIVVVLACKPIISSTPDTNKSINEAEREYLRKAFEEEDAESLTGQEEIKQQSGSMFKKYITSRSFWGLCLGFGAYDAFWYGLMTWGPMYLSQVFKVNILTVGASIFIVFGVGVIGELFGGYLIDHLKEKGIDPNKIVKWSFGTLGVVMAIAMYFLSNATTINMAILYLSIAMFCERWVGCTFWSLPATISQRDDVGIVAGFMNMLGNVGGAIVPILVGVIVMATGSYYWAIILFLAFALGISIFPLIMNLNKKVGADILKA